MYLQGQRVAVYNLGDDKERGGIVVGVTKYTNGDPSYYIVKLDEQFDDHYCYECRVFVPACVKVEQLNIEISMD